MSDELRNNAEWIIIGLILFGVFVSGVLAYMDYQMNGF